MDGVQDFGFDYVDLLGSVPMPGPERGRAGGVRLGADLGLVASSVLLPSPPVGPAAIDETPAVEQTCDMQPTAPQPCITGASSSMEGGKGRETGGLDWLSIAVYGNWDTLKYWQLRKVLEAGKLKAQESGDSTAFALPEGGQALVRAAGVRHGPIFAEWVIEHEGVKLHLSKRQFEHESMPTLFVEIGSVPLMQVGHELMVAQVWCLLRELGFERTRDVVSRVDLCVDRPGVQIADYGKMFLAEQYVCLAATDCLYRERKKITGVVFGKGIHCRIYDKAFEVRKNPEKAAVLIAKRWGGEAQEHAVRVEFQLRRDELKDLFTVTDTADLFKKLGAIAEYLTSAWLRFTADKVDRKNKHQGRAGIAAEWEQVQADFQAAFAVDAPVSKRPVKAPARKALLKQAWGCLLAAMAAEGKTSCDYGELQAWLDDSLLESVDETWHVKLKVKALQFQNQFPGVVAGGGSADAVPF